jgi:hypothetical protein
LYPARPTKKVVQQQRNRFGVNNDQSVTLQGLHANQIDAAQRGDLEHQITALRGLNGVPHKLHLFHDHRTERGLEQARKFLVNHFQSQNSARNDPLLTGQVI